MPRKFERLNLQMQRLRARSTSQELLFLQVPFIARVKLGDTNLSTYRKTGIRDPSVTLVGPTKTGKPEP